LAAPSFLRPGFTLLLLASKHAPSQAAGYPLQSLAGVLHQRDCGLSFEDKSHKMLKYSFVLVIVCSLWACNSPKEQNHIIQNRVLLPNTSLTSLFDSLRPATQTFMVSGDKDTLIMSREGTTLSFTKNTFVDERGQPARNVTLDLVELTTFKDIINANLQTVSDNKILQTAGMFFLDAKENGKPLNVAEGKSIYVEVKAAFKMPDMEIFDGEFDKDGKVNWSKRRRLENSLIPIPLELLKFDGSYYGEDACYLSKNLIKLITKPKFENTFISTREFEERSYFLANCIVSEDESAVESPNEDQLLNIYLSNLDKPLFYSDSLVLLAFEKKYKNLDTIKSKEWENYRIKSSYRIFKMFVKQHLTNVVNFEKIGVTSRTTVDQLVAKGYSINEAEKYITLFKSRAQVLKDRKEFINAERVTQRISKLSAYTFSINKLGWVNVDRFLEDEKSQESTFVAQISGKDSKDSIGFIAASLLIPNYGIVISAIDRNGNDYSFTNKGGNYRKLPVGETAMIFAFGYRAGKPYFGNKSITIPKNGTVELDLSQMSERQIKKEIEKMMKD
jgi:hypothetical protein